jgi:hypothetical protein
MRGIQILLREEEKSMVSIISALIFKNEPSITFE